MILRKGKVEIGNSGYNTPSGAWIEGECGFQSSDRLALVDELAHANIKLGRRVGTVQ